MDKSGTWKLAPAYDVTYSYNPYSKWTHRHQMSINGKRDKISTEDILKVAKEMNIKKAKSIIDKVKEVVNNWPAFAAECEIPKSQIDGIAKNHNQIS